MLRIPEIGNFNKCRNRELSKHVNLIEYKHVAGHTYIKFDAVLLLILKWGLIIIKINVSFYLLLPLTLYT